MNIDRETLARLVARAHRAEAADPAEARALADAEEALLKDFQAQFPVEYPGPSGYHQPTLFDPSPYEV